MSTFEQGWAAKSFKDQFPQLSDTQSKKLDDINNAITMLSVHGIINDSQTRKIRNEKMPRVVSAELARVPCADCGMPVSNCCCG